MTEEIHWWRIEDDTQASITYSEGSIQKFEPPKYHYKTMLIELQISLRGPINVKVIYFSKINVSSTRRPIHFSDISANTPYNSCIAKDPPYEGIPSLWTHPTIVRALQPGHLAECSSSCSVELRARGNQENDDSRTSPCNAVRQIYVSLVLSLRCIYIYIQTHSPSLSLSQK